jgi:hypothetical protein
MTGEKPHRIKVRRFNGSTPAIKYWDLQMMHVVSPKQRKSSPIKVVSPPPTRPLTVEFHMCRQARVT